MRLRVRKSRIHGELAVPGSKSHTIRAVAVATMAKGESIINAPLRSGDTLSALNAARALGADVVEGEDQWRVNGVAGNIEPQLGTIDLGNSGTSLRIFTGLAATADHTIRFDGDASLRTRPMDVLLEALRDFGAEVTAVNGSRCPLSVKGPLRGGITRIEGTSSQYITSLLFATPLGSDDVIIKVRNLNERPYVEMTLDWLSRQGIQLEYSDDLSLFHVRGNQAYEKFEFTIPADFSTATFPLAAAAVTGGEVSLANLDFADHQGDKMVFDYFEQMGVGVDRGDEQTNATGPETLKAVELDLNATPDALPALAVAGAVAKGTTIIRNVPQARAKETDRIACMTAELRKLGVDAEELDDGMVINGGPLRGTEVDGHDDHRVVMALAIAGLAAEGETLINGAEAAAITYPGFIEDFKSIGADLQAE